jgi:hypothetical protein
VGVVEWWIGGRAGRVGGLWVSGEVGVCVGEWGRRDGRVGRAVCLGGSECCSLASTLPASFF